MKKMILGLLLAGGSVQAAFNEEWRTAAPNMYGGMPAYFISYQISVKNIDEIFKCEEIDGYILGPYDLSASMGIPGEFDNPKLLEAIEKVKKSAEAHSKPGGIHIIEPSRVELEARIKELETPQKYVKN